MHRFININWFKKKPRRRRPLSNRSLTDEALRQRIWERPGVGLFAWWLIWLTVVIFRVLDFPKIPVEIQPIQPGIKSEAAIYAKIDFEMSATEKDVFPKSKLTIKRGELLVESGKTLTAQTVSILKAYEKELLSRAGRAQWLVGRAGDALILLFTVVGASFFLHFMSPLEPIERNRRVFLLWVLVLLTLALSFWFLHAGSIFNFLPRAALKYALPLALSSILAAILLGPVPAVFVGSWTALAASIMADYDLSVFITGVLQCLVVVSCAQRARSRLAIFRLGLIVGLIGVLCALGFALIDHKLLGVLKYSCPASIGGGIVAALVTLLVLPLLELLFGIATDISLLELADMEHPLLKRLAIEAPGTYQHSLMVANLAQAGAQAINCNPLRVRIAAYFHDIGKLIKPDFFTENIQFRGNPHDDLTPRMSYLVIVSHVKEGINLALRHKLPKPVLDAIEQHHGTGLVSFFYHKAATNNSDAGETNLSPDDFRYPGPKPLTREAAVLSLADSIEAASRSLAKITPASIESLVHDIMEERLRDGQLDTSDLTLMDLTKLKRAFIFTLTNMLHGRISYPADENHNKPETSKASNQPVQNKTAGSLPDEKSLPSKS